MRDIQAICEKRNQAARRCHAVQTEHHQLQQEQQRQHSGMSSSDVVRVAIQKGCIVKAISAEHMERRTRRRVHSSRLITVKYFIGNTSFSPSSTAATVDTDDATTDTVESKLHELHADMVLVTLPLGVLQQSVPKPARGPSTTPMKASAPKAQEENVVDRKQAAIKFSPSLSMAKQEAIHALGMGLENKVLLRFPINASDLNHKSVSSGRYTSQQAATVDSMEHTQPDPGPFIRRLRKLKYFQVVDPKFRLLSLHGMDPKAKPGCLLVHVAPPHACTTHKKDPNTRTEDGTEYVVVAEILELLRDIFGPTVHVPQPIEVKVTEWHRDPFALGAYSHMPPNATVMHKHQMLQPEGVTAETASTEQPTSVEESVHTDEDGGGAWGGRLLFAGEGCSIQAHQCVHGAFETGEAQALKMLETLASLSPHTVAGTTNIPAVPAAAAAAAKVSSAHGTQMAKPKANAKVARPKQSPNATSRIDSASGDDDDGSSPEQPSISILQRRRILARYYRECERCAKLRRSPPPRPFPHGNTRPWEGEQRRKKRENDRRYRAKKKNKM